jgi:phosphohistidine phosphatase SixA
MEDRRGQPGFGRTDAGSVACAVDICLVRHAIAVERGTPGYEDDFARPLTADGRKRMTLAAAGLAKVFGAQMILTSPLVRAAQTADVLHNQFRCSVEGCDAARSRRSSRRVVQPWFRLSGRPLPATSPCSGL